MTLHRLRKLELAHRLETLSKFSIAQPEPRPTLTLVVENGFVQEIWVAQRAPLITVHDYDWGETDPLAIHDIDGAPYSKIGWSNPAWRLGLTINMTL